MIKAVAGVFVFLMGTGVAELEDVLYVDGMAVGITPLDYEVEVGAHEVVGMLPGQPATRQTQPAHVGKPGDKTKVEFSF